MADSNEDDVNEAIRQMIAYGLPEHLARQIAPANGSLDAVNRAMAAGVPAEELTSLVGRVLGLIAPFQRWIDYMGEVENMLGVTRMGITEVSRIPSRFQGFEQHFTDNPTFRRISDSAVFAASERDSDFPLVHAQHIVFMWTSLEALIDVTCPHRLYQS